MIGNEPAIKVIDLLDGLVVKPKRILNSFFVSLSQQIIRIWP